MDSDFSRTNREQSTPIKHSKILGVPRTNYAEFWTQCPIRLLPFEGSVREESLN